MSLATYILITGWLLGAELLFLQIARRLQWLDKPNERSSHTDATTIRSGGVLFYLAALTSGILDEFSDLYFFVGLTLVSVVSFWDDLYSVSYRYRLIAQCIAVGLLVAQTSAWSGQGWIWVGLSIVGAAMLNAYNFMDGINGMTAFYSLVTVGTLWYWQSQLLNGETDSLLASAIIALLIFTCFNARRRAVCFAGDVGSISIAFIILFVGVHVAQQSHTFLSILLLAVYGVDSGLTIAYRLAAGQNILQSHRQHLFQLLVHQLGWPHLRVSTLYALLQLGINGLVMLAVNWSLTAQLALLVSILTVLSLLYIKVRAWLMTG